MISVLVVLVLQALGMAAGQTPGDAAQQPSGNMQSPDNTQQQSGTTGSGQINAPVQIGENPPITGLDIPGLETNVAPRSMLLFGLQGSESLDSNVGLSEGSSAIHSATRGLGSVALQRLWSKYETALDYIGGATFYNSSNIGAQQMHTLVSDNRIFWRTGQLALRDSFTYLPEAGFGYGAYGGGGAFGGFQSGLSGTGFGLPGGGFGPAFNFFGGGQFGSLGQQATITNVAVVDVTQYLSPRSSVTLAGGYGLVHFLNNQLNLINSQQVSFQAGYDHSLSRKDMIALLYGFQSFHYPAAVGAGTFDTDVFSLLYGHRISGRMDFVIGGGPQITRLHDPIFGNRNEVSGSGRARINYRFRRASLGLSYDHFNSNGSGFFAGSENDVVQLTGAGPINRKWTGVADIGYSHSRRLQLSTLGVSAGAFSYGYAGFSLLRPFKRQFDFFVSYQFNEQAFDASFCGVGVSSCNRISQRHVFGAGFDWHSKPIRLD